MMSDTTTHRRARLALGLVTVALLMGWASGRAGAQADKPAEQMSKNIQVFKGLPASQLMTVMQFMRASLGVRCDYCHIAENGKYWMDDKPAKQTARRMIQMVREINRANFDGQPVVTCNSCHRGQTTPVAVPDISQGAFANTTRADPGPAPPSPLPTVEALLGKYRQALAGKATVESIQTRVSKITWMRPKLVNAGTPSVAMIARAEPWAMELYQKAPDKYLAVITSPGGMIYQGFNGTAGWIKTPEGQRQMNAQELARIRRLADLFSGLRLREQFARVAVTGKQSIGGRDTYVVEAVAAYGHAEKFFFDARTGLLRRRLVLSPASFGPDPEQTDYEDYREAGGVRLPFNVVFSYLDDNHNGTARRYTEVKHNLPLDDAQFDPPVRK